MYKIPLDISDFDFNEMESIDLLQEIAASIGKVNTGASKHLENKYGKNFGNLRYRDKLKASKYLLENLEKFSEK